MTVTRVTRPVPVHHGDRVRRPRPGLAPPQRAGRRSVTITDLTSGRACFGLWGPQRPGHPRPGRRRRVSDAAFPYLTARAITVGNVPGATRSASPMSASSAGSCTRQTEFGAASGTRCGRQAGPRIVAGGYRAIDALRLEKGYRAWGRATSRRRRRRTRPASDSRSRSTRVDFIGRDALAARARRGTASACAAWCSTTRGRSAWATSRSASMARWSAG